MFSILDEILTAIRNAVYYCCGSTTMDAAALFGESLGLIERLARAVCRRAGVLGADADDFVSTARLALMEDDYARLRYFEERSSLSTYLTVVFQRLLADERARSLGRWNVSREAERLGPAAVALETIVRRDHRSVEEALPLVRAIDPSLDRRSIEALLARLPEREPRARTVPMPEEASHVIASVERTDGSLLASERDAVARRANTVMRSALRALPLEDRMLLRFRFILHMTIADVSRMLRLPQRPLYRRIEAILGRLRDALISASVDPVSIAQLIGTAAADFDFGLDPLENGAAHPSHVSEGVASAEELS